MRVQEAEHFPAEEKSSTGPQRLMADGRISYDLFAGNVKGLCGRVGL